MKLFDATTYTARRSSLAQMVNGGIILIMGNEEAPMNYKDNIYHYRQNSNFLYYFGIQQAGLNAIIDTSTGEAVLYGHELTMDDIIWVGEVASLSELSQRVGVSTVKPPTALSTDIQAALALGRHVHYLPPYRIEHHQIIKQHLDIPFDIQKEHASLDLIKAVIDQRSFKSQEEIMQMEHAVNITRDMHIAAMQATKPMKYEYEVVGQIKKVCAEHHANLAYGVIFSVNGQVLHNHHHDNLMHDGRMVINDSGAENEMCYAGDITRSFPVNGKFTQKQKEIYSIVLEMEKTSIDKVRAGIMYRDIHLHANTVLIKRFKELGLLTGDTETMVEEGVAGLFMPHGLGHMIGLDVHDMEDLGENYVGYHDDQVRATYLGLKSLRLAKTLQAGYVLTVEPGIYFIPQLIEKYKAEGKFASFVNYDALKNYYDFGGIRIEDNVLVKEEGSQVLGDYIAKELEEVEEVMQG